MKKKNVNDKQHQKRRPVNYYMRFTNISTVIIDKKKNSNNNDLFCTENGTGGIRRMKMENTAKKRTEGRRNRKQIRFHNCLFSFFKYNV